MESKKIVRIPLVRKLTTVVVPDGSQVLSAGVAPKGRPAWLAVVLDPEAAFYRLISLHLIPTGAEMMIEGAARFVGTFVDGAYVFHVFAVVSDDLIPKERVEMAIGDMKGQNIEPVGEAVTDALLDGGL